MTQLKQFFSTMVNANVKKIIISKPRIKNTKYKKIVAEYKVDKYQLIKYTDKQVFHENVTRDSIVDKCMEIIENSYRQINGVSETEEHIILISRDGKCTYKVKKMNLKTNNISETHNRKKNYILTEGVYIEPLVDMGIFTKEGKVVNAMYDKYRQINRFIEILDDEVSKYSGKKLNVIDFGCGKSYLSFVVYYYLTKILNIEVNMIGLDLKSDVIDRCNETAKKYKYDNLKFDVGDINGYEAPFNVDMVITLHACDIATDYALYNAIKWNARMIFSVPCCQHELNEQLSANSLTILARYGIIKERFSALATDAIRGNLLEYCGYKTQLIEFIDFAHTPKNILIRAVRRTTTSKSMKERALKEVNAIMREFSFAPTLYQMLLSNGGKDD